MATKQAKATKQPINKATKATKQAKATKQGKPSMLDIFKASQSQRQGKASQAKGLKIVPSGKMYINIEGISKGDYINIVYGKQSLIFRLATSQELELAKKDKAIASHIYKVSGDRQAVSLPKYAIELLGISQALTIGIEDIESESIDNMAYYQAIIK